MSNHTQVYYYQLSFIGRFSFFRYPHNLPYGVHHGDEMQYIFETAFVGPRIEISDPENFMVQRMTRIIEHFATTGYLDKYDRMEKYFIKNIDFSDPNNNSDEYLKDMTWPVHDSIDEFYLDIGTHFTEKHGLALERYAIWDKLDKSSAANLFEAVKVLFLVVFSVLCQSILGSV